MLKYMLWSLRFKIRKVLLEIFFCPRHILITPEKTVHFLNDNIYRKTILTLLYFLRQYNRKKKKIKKLKKTNKNHDRKTWKVCQVYCIPEIKSNKITQS